MEKSVDHLKKIQRLSRQSRHHRIHLNQIEENQLRFELDEIKNQREQSMLRSAARRRLEEERKSLAQVTVQQIARDRQEQIDAFTRPIDKGKVNRPSSDARKSCTLFSNDCQFYPCQPVYQYTSFVKKENDKLLRQRNPQRNPLPSQVSRPEWQETITRIQENKYKQSHRPLAFAVQNQNHLVNRHISMQRTMNKLDEQSRLLRERLADKKTFGYVKEQRQKLSKEIQRHLEISAKVCA